MDFVFKEKKFTPEQLEVAKQELVTMVYENASLETLVSRLAQIHGIEAVKKILGEK